MIPSGWDKGFLADRTVEVEEEISAVREHASLLKACGVSVMVYGECGRMPKRALDIGMSGPVTIKSGQWAGNGDRLSQFAERLQDDFGLGLPTTII
ncbi:hypothetical protein IAE29_23135 [Ochrobactrum sp. S46]|nr:hypothetical protein [Ochrobactrum sp. S45]MBK0046223.1 hypothetical protein [Ochrobactrum sp. S46]